jgi:hypothetical protein
LISVERLNGKDCIIRCKKCEERDINSIKLFLTDIDKKCDEIKSMKNKIDSILENITYD